MKEYFLWSTEYRFFSLSLNGGIKQFVWMLDVLFHSLSSECSHYPDNILSTNRAFGHLFSTPCTRTHMPTFKHYTVDWMIHTYFAKFFVLDWVFTCIRINVSIRFGKHLANIYIYKDYTYIYKEFSTYYVPSSALCSCFHNLVTILSSSSFSTTPLKVTLFMASNFFNCVTLNSFSSSKLSISAK